MRSKLLPIALAAVLVLAGCNLPGGSGENAAGQVQTAAAETVSAQLTQNSALTPSATDTPLPTATQAATNTPSITNTPAPTTAPSGGNNTAGGGCDAMAFVSDVTVPDGTDFAPDATFTKTWRIRNSGTCTWSTAYSVVFSSGNSMGGPASQALTANIAPNSTLDVSVSLKAPATSGTYTGYWALRNAAGQTFGSFYVVIDVTSGGSGSSGSSTGKIFPAANIGQVDANGNVGSAPNVGSLSDVGVRAFVSFDISSIPTGATINSVSVDFSGFDTQGNPFSNMGCLQAYAGNFFALDASDYSASGSGPDMSWCSTGELSTVFDNEDVKDRLQAALGSATTLQYQLRFSGSPTGSTQVRFLNGGLKLIIAYTE